MKPARDSNDDKIKLAKPRSVDSRCKGKSLYILPPLFFEEKGGRGGGDFGAIEFQHGAFCGKQTFVRLETFSRQLCPEME